MPADTAKTSQDKGAAVKAGVVIVHSDCVRALRAKDVSQDFLPDVSG